MKKPGRSKKKSLSSRKGKRARRRRTEEQRLKAAQKRSAKLDKGWTPKRVVPERPDPREVAAAKRKERKEKRQAEAEKQATITARLAAWMERIAKKRAGKEVEDAE